MILINRKYQNTKREKVQLIIDVEELIHILDSNVMFVLSYHSYDTMGVLILSSY